ncbi:MAG: tRNA (adenosine(37)-N6)-dimethylallyltransferase MiaA [Microbacteriaceae bacterium]|nr:tRNA (adenosine(37)-N6)-dimethylallyltransferase MiaA [Microbacteriaceae bacterium]
MPNLIAVVGPTGTGKSELALNLAQDIIERGGASEIINCDSMQFYRGMNIGTAKLEEKQQRGIKHHLIDWLDIRDESTAAEFQVAARPIIVELQDRGVTPILVGGSMLYAASVLNTFEFPARDEVLRAELEQQLIDVGPNQMHRLLQTLDAGAADRIDPMNGRRIVRAIEIVKVTGQPFAAALPEVTESWQPVLEIGITGFRATLVERLKRRAELMWQNGLLDEVQALIPVGIREGKTSSQAIGYAQALAQLDGAISQAQAIEQTSMLTARYARRQMSWFRRDERINWLDFEDAGMHSTAIELVRQQVPLGQ